MLAFCLRFVLRHRAAVALCAALCFAAGLWGAARLPLDVVPDISNVQVQVLTPVPNLAPEEAETSVTRPVELAMSGLPGLEETRSITTFGVSQVALIFRDGTDPYRARQVVSERLPAAVERLPRGLSPRLGPLSTGLGEVFTYALAYRPDAPSRPSTPRARLLALKTLQDFVVRPAVQAVPGLADVNTTGGFDHQFVVEPDVPKLAENGLDLADLVNTLARNAAPGAGALVDRGPALATIRSLVRAQTPEELGGLTVKLGWGALPVLLGQVAHVNPEGARPRTGAATLDGEEAVLGTALMLPGENGREVARRVGALLADLPRRLPAGVVLRPLYDRSTLVDSVLGTVRRNLLEGALLVVTMHLLLLGNWRGALIVVSVIPLAFVAGLAGLSLAGFSGNLMSLGAIDFGLLVDGAIVTVDNVARRLAVRRRELGRPLREPERHAAILLGCREVAAPTVCGSVLITLVYLPILGLGGVEGKMFRPLAAMAALALLAALVLSLTLVPALCRWFLCEDEDPAAAAAATDDAGGTTPLMRALDRVYRPLLGWSISPAGRWTLLGVAGVLGALALWTFTRLGAEFLPRLDEGSLVVEVQRDPTVNLDRSVALEAATEQAILRGVPEITHAFARVGASDIVTDPQGPNQNDIYLSYKPRREWRHNRHGHPITKDELADAVLAAINKAVPGQDLTTNQPIAIRFGELLEGVHADVGVKVFGPDNERLDDLANQVRDVLRDVPGADEVSLEAFGRTETLEIHPNAGAMRRFLAQGDEINRAVEIACAGQMAGRVDQGEVFFPLVVRLSDADRANPALLDQLPLRSAEGTLMLALKQVAAVTSVPRLNRLTHENGERRRAIRVNLRRRRRGGFRAGGPAGGGGQGAAGTRLPGGVPGGVRAARQRPRAAAGVGDGGGLGGGWVGVSGGGRLAACAGGLRGGAAGVDGRGLRVGVARAAVHDPGGGGLHRAGRGGDAQRAGAGVALRAACRARRVPGGGRRRERAPAAAPGVDDGGGGGHRLPADGPGARSGRGNPASAGHGGHRRHPQRDGADPGAHPGAARPPGRCPRIGLTHDFLCCGHGAPLPCLAALGDSRRHHAAPRRRNPADDFDPTVTAPSADRVVVTARNDDHLQEVDPALGIRIYQLGPAVIDNQGQDARFDEVLLHAPGVSRESGGQYPPARRGLRTPVPAQRHPVARGHRQRARPAVRHPPDPLRLGLRRRAARAARRAQRGRHRPGNELEPSSCKRNAHVRGASPATENTISLDRLSGCPDTRNVARSRYEPRRLRPK